MRQEQQEQQEQHRRGEDDSEVTLVLAKVFVASDSTSMVWRLSDSDIRIGFEPM